MGIPSVKYTPSTRAQALHAQGNGGPVSQPGCGGWEGEDCPNARAGQRQAGREAKAWARRTWAVSVDQNTPSASPTASASPSARQRSRSSAPICLGVGADDERVGHGLEAPAGGDARDLPRRVLPVAARADQAGVGPAVDAVQRGVVAAVEEVLELPAHGSQVLGRGEQVAVGGQHIVRPRLRRVQQPRLHRRLARRAGPRRLGHLGRAAGQRVVDDEQGLAAGHACIVAWGQKASSAMSAQVPSRRRTTSSHAPIRGSS
jgi:hypothetical protein